MRLTILAAAAALCLSSGAGAWQEPAAKPAKKPADPNRKICRSSGSTGSHMISQICHTKAEWDAIAEANAAATADALSTSRGTMANPGATRAN